MIDPDLHPVFPNNVVSVIRDGVAALPYNFFTTTRPLRTSDPGESVAVFASTWAPDVRSKETGQTLGGGRNEFTVQTYAITLQGMVSDMDENRGLSRSSILAKILRDVLLRNAEVGVALASLSVTDVYGLTERVGNRSVQTQRFMSNEISGNWLYLSTLEFLIETETA